jgi:DNA polymerase elongation subunit (family B)
MAAEVERARRDEADAAVRAKVAEARVEVLEGILRSLMADWPEHKEWYCAKKDPCAWCQARSALGVERGTK